MGGDSPIGAAEFEMALEIVQTASFAWIVTQDEVVRQSTPPRA